MKAPARSLVAALEEHGPQTPQELSRRLKYPVDKVLSFITEARVNGYPIVALRDPGVANVPAKAQPEAGAWTTLFAVTDQRQGS